MSDTAHAEAPASVNEGVIANPTPDAGTPPAPTPVTIVEQKGPTLDEDLDATWERLQKPPRGEAGRFAKREAGADDAAAPDGTEETTDQPEGKATEPAKPAIGAPHSWSADMKAKWNGLPPEVQSYVAQRESDVHKAITRAGEHIKAYEQLDQVIQHHQQTFSKRGVAPAQGIAMLLDAQARLDNNVWDGLVQISASYGIDLRPALQILAQMQNGQQPVQPQRGPDPYVADLIHKVQQMQGQMDSERQAVAQAQETELQKAIDDFAKDKPYFEDAREIMIPLLASEKAGNLEEAYDMAVNAHKELRLRIQEDQRKDEAKKAEAAAKAKADAARKSAGVNVRSGSATQSPKSIDDTLNAAWDKINAA